MSETERVEVSNHSSLLNPMTGAKGWVRLQTRADIRKKKRGSLFKLTLRHLRLLCLKLLSFGVEIYVCRGRDHCMVKRWWMGWDIAGIPLRIV